MPTHPTLSLCIPVYRGGDYWRECWETVLPLASKFDSIVVGLNKSDLQESDAHLIKANQSENMQIVYQSVTLTPVQHIAALVEKIKDDYVLFLCHDDYLLSEGVSELRKLIDERVGIKIAVFGSHRWGESESTYRTITRELLVFPDGAELEQFVMADMDHAFAFSLSGLVSHTASLHQHLQIIRCFDQGFRLDNLVVTVPGIERVFQTSTPLVEIRLHPHQAGRQPQVRARAVDNMSYYFIQALYGHDVLLVRRALKQIMMIGVQVKRRFVLFHLVRLFFVSLAWNGNRNYWPCAKFMMQWLLTTSPTKIVNVVLKMLSR